MSSQERKANGLEGFSTCTPAYQKFLMIEFILAMKVLEKRIVDM
jgi:hypothetical protein